MSSDFGRSFVASSAEVVHSVAWGGARFDAFVEVDEAEAARRRTSALGAVTSYSIIEALSALPRDVEIPWDSLPPELRHRLAQLDDAIVNKSPAGATALLRPPLEARMLVARLRNWRQLGPIAGLTSYAPVTVILPRMPRDLDAVTRMASKAGVGIAFQREAEDSLPLLPSQRRVRLDVGRTRFFEVLFGAWLRQFRASEHGDTRNPEPGLQLL